MSQPEYEKNLGTLILTICTISGINNPPDEIMSKEIKSFILSDYRYRNLTATEFKKAFDFNLRGEYKEKIKHFNLFSVDYMCEVLNSFLNKKQKISESIIRPATDTPPPTEQEKLRSHREAKQAIINDYTKYCNGKLREKEILVVLHKYTILERYELIKLSNEDKNLWMESARNRRRAFLTIEQNTIDLRKEKGRSIADVIVKELREGKLPQDDKSEIANIAREMVIFDHFNKWKTISFDLTGALMTKDIV